MPRRPEVSRPDDPGYVRAAVHIPNDPSTLPCLRRRSLRLVQDHDAAALDICHGRQGGGSAHHSAVCVRLRYPIAIVPFESQSHLLNAQVPNGESVILVQTVVVIVSSIDRGVGVRVLLVETPSPIVAQGSSAR